MSNEQDAILRKLLECAPFAGPVEARSALRAAFSALQAGLSDEEAQSLADEIGLVWAKPSSDTASAVELTLEEFYRLMALHEQKRLALAMEHAQVVCAVLSEVISDATREALRRNLPELAPLFERSAPPEPAPGPQHLRTTPAAEHTLAAGRPGGARPLSTGRPTSSQPLSEAKPERSHAHSVARSDDPHADTRLSSARGLTQEREQESLGRSGRSVRR